MKTVILTFLFLMLCSPKHIYSQNVERQTKSVSTALALTITGTVIPIATGFLIDPTWPPSWNRGKYSIPLYCTGIIVGPSIGKIYAHDIEGAIPGLLIRSLVGSFFMVQNIDMDKIGPTAEFYIRWIAGASILTYSVIRDISTTRASVNKFNEKLNVSPSYNPRSKSMFINFCYTLD